MRHFIGSLVCVCAVFMCSRPMAEAEISGTASGSLIGETATGCYMGDVQDDAENTARRICEPFEFRRVKIDQKSCKLYPGSPSRFPSCPLNKYLVCKFDFECELPGTLYDNVEAGGLNEY